MWKSLEPYLFLSLKSIPFVVDCKLRHVSIAKPKWKAKWTYFLLSVTVEFGAEWNFIRTIVSDRKLLLKVGALEMLLSFLYLTVLTFYFVTVWTILTKTIDTLQYVNGFVRTEKRFYGKTGLIYNILIYNSFVIKHILFIYF